jgi:hypothetical protein
MMYDVCHITTPGASVLLALLVSRLFFSSWFGVFRC